MYSDFLRGLFPTFDAASWQLGYWLNRVKVALVVYLWLNRRLALTQGAGCALAGEVPPKTSKPERSPSEQADETDRGITEKQRDDDDET